MCREAASCAGGRADSWCRCSGTVWRVPRQSGTGRPRASAPLLGVYPEEVKPVSRGVCALCSLQGHPQWPRHGNDRAVRLRKEEMGRGAQRNTDRDAPGACARRGVRQRRAVGHTEALGPEHARLRETETRLEAARAGAAGMASRSSKGTASPWRVSKPWTAGGAERCTSSCCGREETASLGRR